MTLLKKALTGAKVRILVVVWRKKSINVTAKNREARDSSIDKNRASVIL